MSPHLESALLNRFQAMLRPGLERVECGDGWATLIEGALVCLEMHALVRGEEPREEPLEVLQIKEKFGGLRIYLGGGDDFTEGVCTLAGVMSVRMCEVCGRPGQHDEAGFRTCCVEHREGAGGG